MSEFGDTAAAEEAERQQQERVALQGWVEHVQLLDKGLSEAGYEYPSSAPLIAAIMLSMRMPQFPAEAIEVQKEAMQLFKKLRPEEEPDEE